MSTSLPLPPLPSMSFDDACRAVVDYLSAAIPMGVWMVTRREGSRQIYLCSKDSQEGYLPGAEAPWDYGFCSAMVAGAPHVAPDISVVPEYASAPATAFRPVGAYVGVPILRADGELFGTLCAINEQSVSPAMAAYEPLLDLLSRLLGSILEADLALTDQSRLTERAERDADTDPLTGLLNRRAWDRALVAEEARYRRFGDPAAIVILDLDQLKSINDGQGHHVGDEHLCLAAELLGSGVRETDIVARLGGDEFGVLASHSTTEQTDALLQRLRDAFGAAGVSSSFGQAPFSVLGGFARAWEAADEAMYADKARRRAVAAAPRVA
ncbi:hypothetical protein acdb102_36190 [Acidothermaceae bacterium B102]|nr:hypothetical protein acdb102_36190 [Acidothermaceae bacterium B102]